MHKNLIVLPLIAVLTLFGVNSTVKSQEQPDGGGVCQYIKEVNVIIDEQYDMIQLFLQKFDILAKNKKLHHKLLTTYSHNRKNIYRAIEAMKKDIKKHRDEYRFNCGIMLDRKGI